MFDVVINVVFPIFGVMVAGYACGRLRLMGETAGEVLNRFVFLVALPALIVVSLSRVSPQAFFDPGFVGSLAGGMLAMFVLAALAGRAFFGAGLTAAAVHSLCAMFSSTGYIGLPLVLLAWGEEAIAPGVFGAVVTGAVFLPIALLMAEVDASGARGAALLWPVARSFRNPLLIATVAGLLLSAAGVTLPTALATFGDLLGDAYVPCALFAAGLFFARCTVRGGAVEVGWLLLAKLALHPLVTWLLARWVFDLRGELLSLAVVLAALPTGAPVLVVAQRYGRLVDRATAAIVLSTAISMVTVSALLVLLK